MPYLKLFRTAITAPLIMLSVVTVLYFVWTGFGMPQDEAIIAKVGALFDKYGLWVALVSSFLEVLLLIGWYFPGSVVIFLSVILAENLTDVFLAICAVTVGMQAGYFINFFLGKYGWYKLLLRFGLKKSIEDTQHKMERNGLRFLLFTYWHPGLGSVSATVAGILQFPVRKFFMFSLAAVVVWNVFWAGVVYFVGEQSITLFFSWPFVLTILFVWTVVRFIGLVREEKKVSI